MGLFYWVGFKLMWKSWYLEIQGRSHPLPATSPVYCDFYAFYLFLIVQNKPREETPKSAAFIYIKIYYVSLGLLFNVNTNANAIITVSYWNWC